MKNASGIAQLILRLALGLGFILPVMDRSGLFGPPGVAGVNWGDWSHFIDNTNKLMPFFGRPIANIMGILATLAEAIFGICLIAGFKIKQVALGAGLLTLLFGFCMAAFISIKTPFNYPVFVFTGGAFVLSGIGYYKWSIDELIAKKNI